MKRKGFLSLIILLVGVTSLGAQENKEQSARSVYEKWRSNFSSTKSDGEQSTLAVTARRESPTALTLDIVVAGEMSAFTVKMRPAKLAFDQSSEDAGEAATIRQDMRFVTRGAISNPTLAMEIGSDANVAEILLSTEGGPQPVSLRLILPIDRPVTSAALGVTRATGSAKTSMQVRPNLDCPQCFTASLNCEGGCSVQKQCKYDTHCSANY
jgi:hypothetical protein